MRLDTFANDDEGGIIHMVDTTNPDTRQYVEKTGSNRAPDDDLTHPVERIVALVSDTRHPDYQNHDGSEWTIDSGASVCMSSSKDMFHEYKPAVTADFVSIADKRKLAIKGYGKLSLIFYECDNILSLKKVAYVPELCYNLISMGTLDDAAKRFIVGGGKITMSNTDLLFMKRFGT